MDDLVPDRFSRSLTVGRLRLEWSTDGERVLQSITQADPVVRRRGTDLVQMSTAGGVRWLGTRVKLSPSNGGGGWSGTQMSYVLAGYEPDPDTFLLAWENAWRTERAQTNGAARGPYDAESHQHMRLRQQQNRRQAAASRAETWAMERLRSTSRPWTRQAIRGWRLYDFWNADLGVAVEIDGPEHGPVHDLRCDFKDWAISRIVVIRVRNFHEGDMEAALSAVAALPTWSQRRAAAGLIPGRVRAARQTGRCTYPPIATLLYGSRLRSADVVSDLRVHP